MKQTLSLIALLAAVPALAEETRELGAHEHGVGALDIAIDGTTVAMAFKAPGADIVGFEYAAESAEDRAAIDAAVATLARPLDLFLLPAAAACSVTQASAELESEAEHDHDKEHTAHGEDEDHADHDHEEHADDDHEEHAEHDQEEHAEHDHDKHDHEAHAEEANHTEFHAEYTLACANPEAMSDITFAYFETFENARELEVQIVTSSGAQAFEVTREDPKLDLRSLF